MSPIRNKGIWLIFILFILKTMVVLGTELEHSGDGWGYACEILRGNYLSGHHLLYNVFGKLWLELFSIWKLEPIIALTEMNVVFGTAALLVVYYQTKMFGYTENASTWTVCFVAGCFGFFRYSLENETYIIPLFFGILGLYYFNKNNNNRSSWLLLSLACLFHQIYIFWLLPVLIFNWFHGRKFQGFIESFLIISVPYLIASFLTNNGILSIVFQDVESGLVNNYFSFRNLLVGIINVFRSYLEIHGRIWPLIKSYPISAILAIALLIQLVMGVIFIVKSFRKITKKNVLILIKSITFWILTGTLLFAFWSNGNAEFMVSIPILTVFIANKGLKKQFPNNTLILNSILLTIWSWNIVFFLLPKCNSWGETNSLSKVNCIVNQLNKGKSCSLPTAKSDTAIFISMEAATLYNCLDYLLLTNPEKNAPPIVFVYPYEFGKLRLHRFSTIYTDNYSDKNQNRASLLATDIKIYSPEHIDSIQSKTGTYRISKIDSYFVEF